jgi:hypothetical protein
MLKARWLRVHHSPAVEASAVGSAALCFDDVEPDAVLHVEELLLAELPPVQADSAEEAHSESQNMCRAKPISSAAAAEITMTATRT